jgi:hypothetical protein
MTHKENGAMPKSSYNQTSGHYLLGMMEKQLENDPTLQTKYYLAFDVFIKMRSYALINKVFFIVGSLLSVAVLGWPIFAILFSKWVNLISGAALQTIVTAAAAGAIYVYQYYKKRQVSAENLLRTIAFSDFDEKALVALVIDEMSKIDTGFGFQMAAKKRVTDKT